MNRIRSNCDAIQTHAENTVSRYFRHAVLLLSGEFGCEYPRDNPENVVALVQAMTKEEVGVLTAQQIREGMTEIANAIKGKEEMTEIPQAIKGKSNE